MKYKCLVLDHDDTVVNSTATIHHPCFCEYLALTRPGLTCDLETYFRRNFDPGMLEMCREDYGMSEEELKGYMENMKEEDITEMFTQIITQQVKMQYAAQVNTKLFRRR